MQMSTGTPNYYFTAGVARRRAASQATQVAIYRVLKSGALAAKPSRYVFAADVPAAIETLQNLNPGSTYTTKDAR